MKPIIACLFLLLSGCGPYIPLHEPPYSPHKVSTASALGVTVSMQHLGNRFQHFVFDLEVVNESGDTIRIVPHDHLLYYAAPRPFPNANRASALHPESASHSRLEHKRRHARSAFFMDHLMRQRLQEREAATVLFALLGAGLVVYDAARPRESQGEPASNGAEAKRAVVIQAAFVAADASQNAALRAAHEAYELPYEMFAEVLLPPGHRHQGKVFLPIEAPYRYLRLVLTLPEGDYVFDFRREGTSQP